MPYCGTEHTARSSGTLAPTVSMLAGCSECVLDKIRNGERKTHKKQSLLLTFDGPIIFIIIIILEWTGISPIMSVHIMYVTKG